MITSDQTKLIDLEELAKDAAKGKWAKDALVVMIFTVQASLSAATIFLLFHHYTYFLYFR